MAGEDRAVVRSNYNQRAQVARQRALRELARRHADEFTVLHDEERAKDGLAPVDPSRFKGDRYERTTR